MKVYKNNLALFFKDILIGNYPLTELKTYEKYKYQGEYLIVESLKKDVNIKTQIYVYTKFCNLILKRKKEKLGIWRSDYNLFLACIFALIKFKKLDEDESILIVGKKRKNKTK